MLNWSHILTSIKELHPTLSPLSVFLTQVVFSSCELGVFDALLDAERPLSAEEISQAIGASLDGTERLLAACTGLQLLNAHRDDRQGQQHHPPSSFALYACLTRVLSPCSDAFTVVSSSTCPTTCVQCFTVTQSRPAPTWPAPALYPSASLSSTVPEPSTSAGTTWRMLSGQYTERGHTPDGRQIVSCHPHGGRHHPQWAATFHCILIVFDAITLFFPSIIVAATDFLSSQADLKVVFFI